MPTWQRRALDRWEALADLLEGRYGLAAVVHRDELYALGGASIHSGSRSSFARYRPEDDTWEDLAEMPTARCHLAAVVL